MFSEKTHVQVSVDGQSSMYLYNILNNINKFKVLLVFLNKNFTWHRELKSFGIYSKDIEETLNEFNNLGLIEVKELLDLDEIQYETFTTVKQDIKYYFKIYFITQKFYDLIEKHQEDCFNTINNNKHLLDFIDNIKLKLKPFLIKQQQILEEEHTQHTRRITLNGITFDKDTLMSKEVKKFLQLTSTKKGTDLILKEIKPLALMTQKDKNKYLNKVIYNGVEVSSNSIRDLEEQDKQSQKEFKNITIGKSLTELEIEREQQDKDVFKMLGIK